ncbi:radical SAM protein [Pseudodesulfovibrio sp.]|nr:radical SAM protein [Pseudodesulfovibrio sp.]
MEPTSSYANHPCFGMTSRRTVGRLHLPVAPRSNAKIRFAADTKATPAVTPEEALAWMQQVVADGNVVDVVGITGPGDPLAVVEPTLRTLRLVREAYPEISLCLTTLGIGGDLIAEELAEIGLSHITVLVDAVTPEVAEKLYAWIRPSTKTMPLPEAAKALLNEQAKAVTAFKRAGITVKINTTVYPGYNAGHVEEVAAAMAALGADIMGIVPYGLAPGHDHFPADSSMELISTVRDRAARHMDLMPAWEQCGEDLVGLNRPGKEMAPVAIMPRPSLSRPNVAVVSSNGIDVDMHLGHAITVLIYGPREDGLQCLLETRDAPEAGTGSSRWKELAKILSDCFVLLTASAGEKPRENLSRKGLSVLITDGEVESTVDLLYGGGKKGKGRKTAA